MREDIKSMTLAELQEAMKSLGQPAFRAGQIYTWLHRGARSFGEMTNLSKDLRQQLEERYEITVPQVVRKQESRKDGTVKYLWRLSDGNCVETVLMRYHYGNSVCISSEVGCPMGCAFCASTLGGWCAVSGPRRCWIRCSSPSWTPDCPFLTLCSWALGSRWITWTRCSAFWSW